MEPLTWFRIVAPIVACMGFAVVAVWVPRFRFAVMGLVAMVGYGILQDQVSARLCPEYFTVAHPPVPGLKNPTLLGIAWGFLGSWWGGLLMGYFVGLAATLGPRPPLTLRDVVRPMLVLLVVVGVMTALTGVNVWRHAELLGVSLDPFLKRMVPADRHRWLMVVACYHFTAYTTATLASIVLCAWVWRERAKR